MSEPKTYGELLREHREAAARTLEEVANHLDVTISYVGDVERGRRAPWPPQRTMQVAEFLKCDWSGLLDARARWKQESTLQLGASPRRDALALSLSRQWLVLDDDQLKRIADVLEEA
jgi:transcriptional regulator with XRE-family HTH domain